MSSTHNFDLDADTTTVYVVIEQSVYNDGQPHTALAHSLNQEYALAEFADAIRDVTKGNGGTVTLYEVEVPNETIATTQETPAYATLTDVLKRDRHERTFEWTARKAAVITNL